MQSPLPVPTTFRIFDGHAHLLAAPPRRADGSYEVADDLAFRLALMDKCGIAATAVMASNVYERPRGAADTRAQNDFVAWYRDNHGERFPIALGTVEPNQGLDEGLAEIRRMKEVLRLDGVVWHNHFSGAYMDDARMVAFAQELAKLDMPACVHLNIEGLHESASFLGSLALKAPDTTIVALGAFSGHRNLHDMHDVANRCPYVLFDTSLLWPIGQTHIEFAERYGADRVIFGTDMHFIPKHMYHYPAGLLDILLTDRLTDEDRENILWNNARRVYPRLAKLGGARRGEKGPL
jgi:predicted TIM-barrel fold metal-dependent hydrolase